MVDYLSPFAPEPLGVHEVHNAGSIVLLAPLAIESVTPTVATLTVVGTAAIGDVAIDLTSSVTGGTWVRRGSILDFGGAKKVVVNKDVKVLIASTEIECEPLTTALVGAETTQTWGLLELLSPINIPLNSTDQSEDRTDLSFGLQGQEVKTKVMAESQIQVFDRPDDRAYNELVQPASTSGIYLFAHIARSGGKHAWGRVQISGNTDDGAQSSLSKPQFTLKFQAPYAQPTRWEYETTAKKALMNDVMKLSGLAIYA